MKADLVPELVFVCDGAVWMWNLIKLHYHRRWDIEIAYDEIKTHQCVTLRGQAPTTFRSKRPDLVQQEIYALAITYNLVRTLIRQAAAEHGQDPTTLSFLDALQHILDAAPLLTADTPDHREQKRQYLLTLLADCPIDAVPQNSLWVYASRGRPDTLNQENAMRTPKD